MILPCKARQILGSGLVQTSWDNGLLGPTCLMNSKDPPATYLGTDCSRDLFMTSNLSLHTYKFSAASMNPMRPLD
eukprot:231415-Pleurochrysis_carterae.AAC.1